MRTALLLLSCFGPPLLMVMGIAVCLSYLGEFPRGRWIGLVAFLVVGVPVSVAAYLETRSTGASHASANNGVAHADTRTVTADSEHRARPNQSGPRKMVFAIAPRTHRSARLGQRRVRSHQSGPRYVVRAIPTQSHGTPPVTATSVADKQSAIPPNTLTCKGFTRDPDGAWEAGSETKPFDVGSETNFTIRNQGPISPHWISVGNVDLFALLSAKCGTGAKSPN